MVTSLVRHAPSLLFFGHRSKQRLSVEQLTQRDQRRRHHQRLGSVAELRTEAVVQHPGGQRQLHPVLPHPNEYAAPFVVARSTKDLYFFAVEWMLPAANCREGRRFMGSTVIPCGIVLRRTCSQAATTFALCRSCSVTRREDAHGLHARFQPRRSRRPEPR